METLQTHGNKFYKLRAESQTEYHAYVIGKKRNKFIMCVFHVHGGVQFTITDTKENDLPKSIKSIYNPIEITARKFFEKISKVLKKAYFSYTDTFRFISSDTEHHTSIQTRSNAE